jgi:hypothetical protein
MNPPPIKVQNSISASPGLEAAVKRAVGLIKEVENDWTEKCRVAKDALNEASAVVTAAKEKVNGLMNEKASLTSNTTRTERKSHRTNRATDTDALDELLDKIVEANLEQRTAKAAEKKVKDESDEVCASFEKWKEKFPHRTQDSLMAHGKSILQPAGEYYKKLFTEEGGVCYNIRNMSEAALIFDPIELSEMSDADVVTVNHYRADQLDFFRYDTDNLQIILRTY